MANGEPWPQPFWNPSQKQPLRVMDGPVFPMQPYHIGPARGCICPPGANKDCEAPMCPRKPLPKG